MNTKITTQIENMKAPISVRTKMCTLYNMAKSVGKGNGYLMPSLLVVSDGGESDTIGKLYAEIFDEFDLYKQRGEKNYFKLTYPAEGNDSLYSKFFASGEVVASTTNRYYGVFAIDLNEWKSGRNIAADNSFNMLLNYIEENKKNITFVFCINEGFQAREELMACLKKRVNLECIQDVHPQLQECSDYIAGELQQEGLEVTNAAKLFIERIFEEGLYKENSMSFDTLDLMVQKILLNTRQLINCEGLDSVRVDWELINQLSPRVFEENKDTGSKQIIGFIK